jgi:hypothetical protein
LSVESLKNMQVTEFVVDPSVQRQLNEPRVNKLAKDFNPKMLGLITASKRLDGRSYILDGQHRIMAARKAGYSGYVATRLYENLTVAEEAQLFLDLNDTRKVNALDKFLVRATMGDPSAVALKDALERVGLRVSGTHAGGKFAAIVSLERVYAGFMSYASEPRIDLVEAVLQILTRAYGAQERKAFQANTVMGVGLILHIFGKRVDADDLVDALRSIPADALAIKGRSTKDLEGGTGAQGVAKVLLSYYNKGKSTRRLEFHEFNDGLAKLRRMDYLTYDRMNPRNVDGRRRGEKRVAGSPAPKPKPELVTEPAF